MKIRIAYQSNINTNEKKQVERYCINCKHFKSSRNLGKFDGVCLHLNRHVNIYNHCSTGFREK